jgi:hypothetical protein
MEQIYPYDRSLIIERDSIVSWLDFISFCRGSTNENVELCMA